MATTFSSEPSDGGKKITGAVSSDETVSIPESIDGTPVVSIGGRAFRNLRGSGGRTLIIPSGVRTSDPDALELSVNIRHIVYKGDFSTFSTFKWYSECGCRVECEDFEYTFPAGHTLSFPEFDEEMLDAFHSDFDSVALNRLSEPRYLSEECRDGYLKRMRRHSLELAQRAVANNDTGKLDGIFKAGILSDGDLQDILRMSLSSGKVASVSTVMSEINRRFHSAEDHTS